MASRFHVKSELQNGLHMVGQHTSIVYLSYNIVWFAGSLVAVGNNRRFAVFILLFFNYK